VWDSDHGVEVTVRRDAPLRTTLRARKFRPNQGPGAGTARGRETVSV